MMNGNILVGRHVWTAEKNRYDLKNFAYRIQQDTCCRAVVATLLYIFLDGRDEFDFTESNMQ